MSSELVIDVQASEISIAQLDDKKLVEVNKDRRDSKFSVGDIYLAKVKKLMPGLNAAFVDVGYEKGAFLHYQDLGPHFLTLNSFMKDALSGKKKGLTLKSGPEGTEVSFVIPIRSREEIDHDEGLSGRR